MPVEKCRRCDKWPVTLMAVFILETHYASGRTWARFIIRLIMRV